MSDRETWNDLEIEFTNLDDDDLIALGESDENILFDAGQKGPEENPSEKDVEDF